MTQLFDQGAFPALEWVEIVRHGVVEDDAEALVEALRIAPQSFLRELELGNVVGVSDRGIETLSQNMRRLTLRTILKPSRG